jgi:hypothetical protein
MICCLAILEFENKALTSTPSLLAQILKILLYNGPIFAYRTIEHTHEPTSVMLMNEGVGSFETSVRTY